MLTSIVILQILIKTKGELGEANRAASRFECNGDVLLIQYSKLEDNERLVFRGNDIIYTLILLIYNMNFDNMEFQYFELKLVMNMSNRLLRVVNNSGSFY